MSLWVSLKRIARSGLINFWRNSFVSLASIFVLTTTLFIVGSLMFVNSATGQFIAYLKDKVDVNVYLEPNADEGEVNSLIENIQNLPEVERVTYQTPEEVFSAFVEKNQDKVVTLRALEEIGENPFGGTISIKAKELSQYPGVAQFLDDYAATETGDSIVEVINYNNNRGAIEQLERTSVFAERFAWVAILLFSIASILITFNTVRLAIYTAREEISVMRLMGASNQYIRGPFLIEGAVYGLISALVTLILFFPLTLFLRSGIAEAFSGVDLFSMYVSQFSFFAVVIIGVGVILGVVSTFLAVRKYLSV